MNKIFGSSNILPNLQPNQKSAYKVANPSEKMLMELSDKQKRDRQALSPLRDNPYQKQIMPIGLKQSSEDSLKRLETNKLINHRTLFDPRDPGASERITHREANQ